MKPRDESADPADEYRPTSRRQRLVIVLLAVATALGVAAAMLAPHVRYLRAERARQSADTPPCTPQQTRGCVGGTMGVIPVPASGPR